jgi:hypothetical protein
MVGPVRDVEERFEQLRRSHACAPLGRDGVTELLAIAGNLIEERRRIRAVLERLPQSFGEVRQLLNELIRTVR